MIFRRRRITIVYQGCDPVEVLAGQSLLRHALDAGIAHRFVCGGRGTCGTCAVQVTGGLTHLARPNRHERRLIRERHWSSDIRLACQIHPSRSIEVRQLCPPVARGDPAVTDTSS